MANPSNIIKVHITTLGCAKNLVDTEVLMGKMKRAGLRVQHEARKHNADVAIINTCGFIGDAKEESIDAILQALQEKKEGKFQKVIVMGCLSQRYKAALQKELPGVDGFYGVNEQKELIASLGIDPAKELRGERVLTTPAHYAYLKISEGCDRKCSFCAIPLIRGKNISSRMEDIVREAEYLAGLGVKELNVIAQDTTAYGVDSYGKRMLAPLLGELAKICGIEWIRLHYAYPSGFPLDVLDLMGENNKLCHYLDIPLQHISPGILRSMKRDVSRARTLKLLETIREKLPGIALRTSLMVGYPGEGEKEFLELLDFVRVQRFDRLGVFTYSPEEGTSAYPLRDGVPQKVKNERAARIMEIQMDISREINESRVGKTFRVLIDRKEGGHYLGRTEYDSPEVDNEVIINESGSRISIGNFCQVKITGADYYDLLGEVVVTSDE